jgi:hypothetical protein
MIEILKKIKNRFYFEYNIYDLIYMLARCNLPAYAYKMVFDLVDSHISRLEDPLFLFFIFYFSHVKVNHIKSIK